jgi:hypothetical protein
LDSDRDGADLGAEADALTDTFEASARTFKLTA